MNADDWRAVALIVAAVLVVALAVLTVVIGCVDDLTAQLKKERSDRRVQELNR